MYLNIMGYLRNNYNILTVRVELGIEKNNFEIIKGNIKDNCKKLIAVLYLCRPKKMNLWQEFAR